MRKLTVLVVLVTGLSMAGAALLAGIVGKQEKPPRMEITWNVETAASFPAPSVEVADASERDTEEIVESDPLREVLDSSEPLVGEGEGLVIIAVDKASGLSLPGAEVAFVDYAQVRARHREEEGSPYANRVELAERYGAVLVTGAEGKVRLPPMQNRTLVAVSHEDKFAGTLLLRNATGEVRLELESDETLVLQVIDSTGVGREGVPLGVYRGEGWGEAKRLWRGSSFTDGFVTLNHFQLLRRRSGKGNRFAAALAIPLGQPAATEFPAAPLAGEPVTITLPLTGSLQIDIVDSEGNGVMAGGRMTLQALHNEERSFDLPLGKSFESLSATAKAGESSFVFPFVGLNLELQPSLRLNGDRRPWKPQAVVGPTAPDETLRTLISLPGDMTLISGVIVNQDGEPLAQPYVEFQLDAAEGQVARSRCSLTDDGGFELVVRLADKNPPFALQVQTRRQQQEHQSITGLRIELKSLRSGHRNDLGTLHLAELQVIAHGTVTDDFGEPVANASVDLQRYHARARDPRQHLRATSMAQVDHAPTLDWHTESLVRSRTDDEGHFELLGKVLPGGLRVRASRTGYMSATSPEITAGTQVDLLLSRAGTLTGNVRVQTWLPRCAVTVRLRSRENPERGRGTSLRIDRRNPGEDRKTYQFNQLPIGIYDLEFELRGFTDPLFQVYGLPIVAGENGQNPQLQGLDLTGLIHRFVLRTHGSDGSKPEEGTVVARHTRPTGEPATTVFPLKGGVAEFVTPSPSLELTVLARGYRPQQLTALAGDGDVYLERSPIALLHIPGLRDLVGPERKVKIVLRNTEPTDLPESLRGIDQSSGRRYSADRSDFGGGSGWLGADDTVSIALSSRGEYEVSLTLQEKGARPVSLGSIQVDPVQGRTFQVPLDRDRVAQEIGPREDR